MLLKKFVLLFCLAASGCWLNTSEPTDRYDLDCRKIGAQRGIQVMEFRNNSGAGLNLVIRRAGHRLEVLRYARWSSEPGVLVARALNQALLGDEEKIKINVSGSLERFEAVPEEKIFRLSGFFIVHKQIHRFDVTTPLAGELPVDIVSAASDALSVLAQRIYAGVNSL